MTLRHIEIFVTVCREKSITLASQRLHISQPTVSIAIREMEAHYGERLFDRMSKQLRITPFGQTVYDYGLQLLKLYTDMSNANSNTNTLRIGTGTAIGKLFMPAVVKSYTSLHPEIKINICVGDAPKMYRKAMENTLDLVIAETVENIPGLCHKIIQHYPVVAVQHRSLPLASQQIVTAADLAAQPLLLRELGSSTRDGVDTYFNLHDLTVTPTWESYSVQTLLNAAAQGLGVAFLSIDHILAYQDPALVILNIPDFHAERYVNIVYHKNKVFTPQMLDFLTYYQSYTQKMLQESAARYQKENPNSPFVMPEL